MAKSDAPKTVRIYPSSTLPEGSYLPGVGIDGAEVESDLAEEWVAAGLARKSRPPVEDPAEPEQE